MKISIIVPVYNVENYIDLCVSSLINQTYEDLEIILVDDGSTDKSGFICDGYAKKDGRIKVVHKENGGLSDARNKGIEAATGEYLMFVDGDDALDECALEKLYDILLNIADVDLIQYTYSEVDKSGKPIYDINYTEKAETVTSEAEKYNRLYKIGGAAASTCTKLYKKSLFDGLSFKTGIIHEDEYIVTDILSKATKVVYYDAALYLYYFREGSIITSAYSAKKKDIFFVIDKRISVLKAKGYYELLNLEYKKLFYAVLRLYCLALKSGQKQEAYSIAKQLEKIPKETKQVLDGKGKYIFALVKRDPRFLKLYYYSKLPGGKNGRK